MSDQLLPNMLDFLAQASPFILAALGGLFSEYVGLLNIGLEGLMLNGAFFALAGAYISGNGIIGIFIGLACALLSGLGWGYLFSIVSLRLRGNIFIAGLALNLLIAGCISMLSSAFFKTRSVISLDPSYIDSGDFTKILFVCIALIVSIGFWLFVRNTRMGLILKVTGNNIPLLNSRGIATKPIQRRALIISCMLASAAGASLSLQLGAFVPNQSAGKGWIALVLVFVGFRHPIGVLIASMAFIFSERIAFSAQALNSHPALLIGMPYFLVLVALVIVEIIRRLLRRVRAR